MSKKQPPIITREGILAADDEKIIDISEKLRIAYKLKKTIRYGRERDTNKHAESVAEHIFALYFLEQFFHPLEDPEGNLSRIRVHEMILFHDFGEILNGDIPYHLKNENDKRQELSDAKEIFQSLPGSLGKKGFKLWNEYESRNTAEAKFVYALDKIEPSFELLDPVTKESLMVNKFTYDMHMGIKLKATKDFPILRKFVVVLGNKLKEDGVFWAQQKD